MSFGRKKIVFIVSSMQGGGAERVASLLCNYWVEAGNDVMLLPTFSSRGECVYPLDERVQLEYLADHVSTQGNIYLSKFLRFFELRKIVKNYSPDVVVSFLVQVNVVTIMAMLGTRIPVVVSERIFPPLHQISWVWSVLRRLTYPLATRVVAQTTAMKRWLEEYCRLSDVAVIPNPLMWPLPAGRDGVNPDDYIDPHRKIILAAGRFHHQKGFDLLLEAFGGIAMQFPEWDLVVLGDGPDKESLVGQRQTLKLNKRIIFPGQVTNICDWYEQADIFAMSSRYEGFPNVLLEALAYGVPAVSFDCETGPSEIILNGESGLLVPLSQGIEGMASAFRSLMESPEKRMHMSQKALEVRQQFGINLILDKWDAVFDCDCQLPS
jgi:GalNAc-alpha-(1->4)-GalNAc-alpha-(1->3)-diNAcBac-PP-undecaprenol alpha-1,4-N-acetyl-D-galactosaminyltransferase